ncbi:MAG: hypothetical protein ACR2KK_10460 [Acidimicrobiales bacterium]
MPRLRAAAGALLLLLLAACGDGDGGSTQAVRDSAGLATPETTTTLAPTTTTVAGRTTTTSAPGARTTTTGRAAAPTTAAAPTGARALTPAAPGTYRYDTSGATTFGATSIPFPAVTTLVVDAPSGTRQRLTRNLRDAAGNGISTEFTLDYRPEGVFLVALRLTTGFSGITDARDLRPASPVLLLATGARPGAHQEVDLTGTSSARLVVDVVGEERVTIAGQPVDTLVMRAAVTLAPGDITGRQELTVNVDRGSRLWVKERSVTDASAGGGLFSVHSEYTATLQRLTP